MRSKSMRICFASMFVFLFFCGASFSMTEEEAARQWDAVRGTTEESTFLINLILHERPGPFPETVKKRFYEIVTPEDATVLLKIWVNPTRKQRLFALTLLRGLRGDEFTKLFEEYLYIASDARAQRRLYGLITHQNSSIAFRAAIKYVHYVHEKGLHREAISYLQTVRIFKNPDIRQEIIDGTASESSITRAASYAALRNYPDDEVLAIIEDALSDDTGVIPGEENRVIPERYIKSGKAGKSLIKDILNTTKMKIEKYRKYNDSYQQGLKDSQSNYISESNPVSSSSSDQELAEAYAPQILLSDGGTPGIDIGDASYPYTDYIPIYVHNATRMDWKNAYLHLYEQVTYLGDTWGPGNEPMQHFNFIGDAVFRSKLNYLDFLTYWNNTGKSIEEGYKSLFLVPSVYFKVFKDPSRKYPIAVQYWFFYYYNDWFVGDHPGDWETITVFLNENAEPKEAIYSTHYEANKYSWFNVDRIGNTPIVYVSNGGHGSYSFPDDTPYSFWGVDDNHQGDREELSFSSSACSDYVDGHYCLLDLSVEENKASNDSWILFEGRWGDEDSAPQGPHFRTDTPTSEMWGYAEHKPYNPEKNCAPRYGEDAANIYGTDDNRGPWRWASGYGLDEPWESENDCKISNFRSHLTSILYLLLLQPSTVTATASASASASASAKKEK